MRSFPRITDVEYLADCKRRFGNCNPERMQNRVWEWMIRNGHCPYSARESLKLDSTLAYESDDPDWCLQRMGAPKVKMPDGRVITIAGEHEDFYDPDFCIYNDVVVRRDDEIEIYGYPLEHFPPTDFHTATLVENEIWLIGSLGYQEVRKPGPTQVLRMDTTNYRIERIDAVGDSPGWVNKHRAELLEEQGVIQVTGGEVIYVEDEEEVFKDNLDIFQLDLATATWRKLTNHDHWQQFSLEYSSMDRMNKLKGTAWTGEMGWYTGEILLELGYPCSVYEDAEFNDDDGEEDDLDQDERVHILDVNGVPVACSDRYGEIRIIIRGELAHSLVQQLIDQIRCLADKSNRTITGVKEL